MAPLIPPELLYHQAQALDEWAGTPHDGTSVRAGAKALVKDREIATAYHWAFALQTVIDTILEIGPVVVGFNWYEAQFTPDKDNYCRIGGDIAGGHAYKLDGVNVTKRYCRAKNSWGPSFGRGGFFRLSFDDLERLLSEDGEACAAVEL